MSKKNVKRCIRPQCMEVYPENTSGKYCDCGAILQATEIEIPDRKTTEQKKPEERSTRDSVEKTGKTEKQAVSETSTKETKTVSLSTTGTIMIPLAYLYLIPENEDEDETEYKLGKRTLIGRSSDTMAVDVDLSEFGGLISRKHALITYEQDGFYITNLSENHSVHINNKVVVNGQKMKLTSGDGVILSKKVLLQFEEGE